MSVLCEAIVYEQQWGFQSWRCEKHAKGRKTDLNGKEYDACGVHLRARHPHFRARRIEGSSADCGVEE